MKFLVTGGAGFIGSHLVERLLELEHEVYCLDNFNDFYNPAIKWRNIETAQLNPNYHLIQENILNYDELNKVFANNKFDIVVHLAARAGVRQSLQNPLLYDQVNVQGLNNLLDLCKTFGIGKFIFASSSSVYRGNEKIPSREQD